MKTPGNVVKVKRWLNIKSLQNDYTCIEFHNDYVIFIGVFCK